jgi:hypothetical protein
MLEMRGSVAVAMPLLLVATAIALAMTAGGCIPATSLQETPAPSIETAPPSGAAALPSPSLSAGSDASPSFVRPTPTPQPTFLAYVVRSGDTLTSIARAHGTTPRSIAFWNRTQHPSLDPDSPSYAPDRIEVGWVLLLVPNLELDPEDLPPEPTATPAPMVSAPPSPAGTG